eukprot:99080_1
MAEEKRFDEYPAEIFVGANEKNKARILGCCVCQSFPMYQATTTGCGIPLHCLCKKCVDRLHQTDYSKCPYCNNPIRKNKVKPNQDTQLKIYQLNVQCHHSGCTWKGLLVQWEEHMNQIHPIQSQQPEPHQPGAGNIQVRVKDILGAVRVIKCHPQIIVKAFKELFEKEQGMPVYEQKFIWQRKTMQDNKTLQSLGIRNGSEIHSVKKFTGGE